MNMFDMLKKMALTSVMQQKHAAIVTFSRGPLKGQCFKGD